ncbi:MAG: PAS domain-containing protein [Rhodospirillaceae bacterium]|jgi:hypothetical protein|nr:PAS domain-containing protein [Rhodospirillaceae bacterium]MBT5664604.1 PAS domain-containing protein [Rhodospirillaceae bacterium]
MDHDDDPAPEFLDGCAAEISKLFHYWNSLRNGRRMPARSDMDPLDIPRLLRYIQLIDVSLDPLEFRYRLVGTRLVDRLGVELTGKQVGNIDSILDDYREVVSQQTYKYSQARLTNPKEDDKVEETVYLPFSDDGETVNIIMVCII